MLLSLPCLDFFKTSWDSSPLHWIYREPLAYSHVGYLRSQGERFSTDRSRPRLKASSLSLSLSLARARGRSNQSNPAPRLPRRPAARSKAVLDLRPSSFLFSLRFRLVGGPPRDLYLAPEPRISSRFSPLAVWKKKLPRIMSLLLKQKKSSHLKFCFTHASSSISF